MNRAYIYVAIAGILLGLVLATVTNGATTPIVPSIVYNASANTITIINSVPANAILGYSQNATYQLTSILITNVSFNGSQVIVTNLDGTFRASAPPNNFKKINKTVTCTNGAGPIINTSYNQTIVCPPGLIIHQNYTASNVPTTHTLNPMTNVTFFINIASTKTLTNTVNMSANQSIIDQVSGTRYIAPGRFKLNQKIFINPSNMQQNYTNIPVNFTVIVNATVPFSLKKSCTAPCSIINSTEFGTVNISSTLPDLGINKTLDYSGMISIAGQNAIIRAPGFPTPNDIFNNGTSTNLFYQNLNALDCAGNVIISSGTQSYNLCTHTKQQPNVSIETLCSGWNLLTGNISQNQAECTLAMITTASSAGVQNGINYQYEVTLYNNASTRADNNANQTQFIVWGAAGFLAFIVIGLLIGAAIIYNANKSALDIRKYSQQNKKVEK